MIFLGKLLSFIAKLLVGNSCKELEQKLIFEYKKFRFSVKTKIPPVLIEMLIIGEDHRFYKHYGVDFKAIIRAIYNILFRRKIEGGSTIEQQLVRTVTNQYDFSIKRKIKEIFLASIVDKIVPKSEIPGLYLSIAYFGWNMNGIEKACKKLGIELPKISAEQAATIIARLKYPEQRKLSKVRKSKIDYRTNFLLNRYLKKRNLIFNKINIPEVKNYETL